MFHASQDHASHAAGCDGIELHDACQPAMEAGSGGFRSVGEIVGGGVARFAGSDA